MPHAPSHKNVSTCLAPTCENTVLLTSNQVLPFIKDSRSCSLYCRNCNRFHISVVPEWKAHSERLCATIWICFRVKPGPVYLQGCQQRRPCKQKHPPHRYQNSITCAYVSHTHKPAQGSVGHCCTHCQSTPGVTCDNRHMKQLPMSHTYVHYVLHQRGMTGCVLGLENH